jgi:hypothetical protein
VPIPERLPGDHEVEAFTALKALVGSWSGETTTGRLLRVSFQLVARETALVERWLLAPGRESLTVYHLDGSRLIATHYCPLGNQPRLQLQPTDESHTFLFGLLDATNLPNSDAEHQHTFALRLMDRGRFVRSETYRREGREERET